jgi:tripartite-type tricarboxylate transporter receptor subunit TctC
MAALAAPMAWRGAKAQAWPDRPLRVIVPYPPGTATDLIARQVAPGVGERLGQPLVVENRPGAGGIIGMETLSRARPDGYTLAMGTSQNVAINASLYPRLPYDPIGSFAPVARLVSTPLFLAVGARSPLRSVAELVAAAKREPGRLNYASTGAGGTPHLAGAYLGSEAGVSLQHVVFNGVGPAVNALIDGSVAFMFYPYQSLSGQVGAGNLRLLAVADGGSAPYAPEVPTMAAQGFPGFEIAAWYGLYAPAQTPAEILARLHAAVRDTMAEPVLRDRFTSTGHNITPGTPAELAAFTAAEVERFRRVVQATGAKLE